MKHVMTEWAIVGTLVLACVSPAAGRTWTTADGKHTTEAEFVSATEEKVTLRREDGTLLEVPLEKLCKADQYFIRHQAGKQGEDANGTGRTWRSADGKSTIRAELLEFKEDEKLVRLKKTDGTEIDVPLDKLSTADQRFLKSGTGHGSKTGTAKSGPTKAATGPAAGAELTEPLTCELKVGRSPTELSAALAAPQRFFLHRGRDQSAPDVDEGAALFKEKVTKEPRYNLSTPLKSVATFGNDQYPFALDASGNVGFDILYFDLNRNGNLLDDKMMRGQSIPQLSRFRRQCLFPPMNLNLDVDGTKMDYACFMISVVSDDPDGLTASASVCPASWRQGVLNWGGRRHDICLLDATGNGRYNDQASISGRGNVVADVLLMDLMSAARGGRVDMNRRRPDVASLGGQYISKYLNIDDRYYDLAVTPAGDKITISPSTVGTGKITNPNPGFRAVMYGDQGVVAVNQQAPRPIPLPEGQWRLNSYTIDSTNWVGMSAGARRTKPKKAPPGKKSEEPAEPATPAVGGSALISAQFPGGSPPIDIKKDESVKLPFGPPYKAVVNAKKLQGGVRLSMSLVGSGGEHCDDIRVNGKRPADPQFRILDANGKPIHAGKFEWG